MLERIKLKSLIKLLIVMESFLWDVEELAFLKINILSSQTKILHSKYFVYTIFKLNYLETLALKNV